MNKKRGFTLAELLAVIVVIGVLALLVLSTVDDSIKKSKERLYQTQLNNIEEAATNWAAHNMMNLPEEENDYITVYLWQLKIDGYIDNNISDPRNGKLFPNDMEIRITRKNNKYAYTVVEGSGTEGNTDLSNFDFPFIALNGSDTINVDLNTSYTELGATAKTVSGVDVTDQIVIDGTVDTTKVGTYSIKYNVTYNGHTAKEVVRTVYVTDKKPVITISPNGGQYKATSVIVKAIPTGYNKIASLTYTLNSSVDSQEVGEDNRIILNKDGNYVIHIKAVDTSGNTSVFTSNSYLIDDTAPVITFAEGSEGVTLKDTEVATYDLKTGVTVKDNNPISMDDVEISGNLSAVVGEYTITYTATDMLGNVTVKTRTIIVELSARTFTEVMTGNSQVAALDPDGNLRYVGADPNNYVWFNKDANGNPERWRIIGVFDGQAKIIKDEYYSTIIAWDENDGSYSNNWATASLQLALNNTTDGYIKTIQTNDPTSYGYIDLEHVWNIGGFDSTYDTTGTRSAFYSAERSETPAGASGSESAWTGAIGLMYPSDYGYASSGSKETCEGKEMYNWDTGDYKTECAGNSWLYDSSHIQWTLTPLSVRSDFAFSVNRTGIVDDRDVYDNRAARPVLFLKSDTKIVGGQGTYDQPFELGA